MRASAATTSGNAVNTLSNSTLHLNRIRNGNTSNAVVWLLATMKLAPD